MDLGAPIEGKWWTPEDPEASVTGSLIEEDDLFVLQPSGPLARSESWAFDDIPFLPMVHGVIDGGQSVTLLGCHCVHRKVDLGRGGVSERWRIESIVRGCLLEDPQEPMNSFRIELVGALEWAGAKPIEIQTDGRSSTTLGTSNESIGRADIEGVVVALQIEHRLEYEQSSAALRQAAVFVLDLERGVDFRAAMNKFVFPVRDLIAFATAGYTEIRSVEGRPEVMSDGGRSTYAAYITRLQRPHKPPATRAAHEVLTLPRLEIPFEQLVPRWFHLNETYRTTVSMLLVPTHAPYLYADSHLLTAWLALDGYHQTAIGGTAIDPDLHDARVAAIVRAAPPEHREWAKNQLAGKNQVGSHRRLQEVMQRSGTTGQAVLSARADFANLAVSGRQQVAHPSVVDSEAGLRYLITASMIRHVLRHCLLVDLGLDPDTAGRLVTSAPDFAWSLEQLASL